MTSCRVPWWQKRGHQAFTGPGDCLLSQTGLEKWIHLQPSLSQYHINSQNVVSSKWIRGLRSRGQLPSSELQEASSGREATLVL